MERLRRSDALRSSLRAWLVSLVAIALLPALALAQANGKLQLHHINVGQGDGILLISPLGETALFDDGNYLSCTGIKNYIQGLGITTIDYHFASHYHADHIGCIDDLDAIGVSIGTAGYDRGSTYSSATFTNYVNTLGPKRQTIAQNQVITLDAGSANPVQLRCIAVNGAGVYSGSDENARSLVMKVSYGAFDEVIGGDLTGDGPDVETTVGAMVGDVEVYKVHHHGSAFSSNANWLSAITAEVGIIQVGNGNSYGHPTASALNRMHAVSMQTYWTQTGAGASPDPAFDTVAGGTILVQADPGSGATYIVSGPGFSDSYTNGGGSPPPPPINTTEVAESITMIKGSVTVGDVTRLAVDDAVRVSISAGVSGNKYLTDWYGTVVLDHDPLNLAITYDGNYTVSRSQTLYLWNWSTGAWVSIDNATVGTTDVTRTWSTSSPAAYVSPTREVRLRVATNNRNSSFTCRGDLMSFNYDYAGSAPQALVAGAPVVNATAVHDHAAEAAPGRPVEQPLQALRRVAAEPAEGRVSLSWAVGVNEHVDGFNIYRETSDGSRVHVGVEAGLETLGDEATFTFVDHEPGSGVYWLGVRGCSGPEAMIGPIRAGLPAGTGDPVSLAFAVAPNPVHDAAGFALALDRAGVVRIDVFDVTGRRIATPFAGWLPAGSHRLGWNRASTDGGMAGPGIYFARLQGGGRTLMSRMTIVAR
jgi:beta-lactamase superfamily II metal-dependent hydrolase